MTPCNKIVHGWLCKESMFLGVYFDHKEWMYAGMKVSQQCNGADCGVLVLTILCDDKNVEYECSTISINKERTPWAIALLKGSLLDTVELARHDVVEVYLSCSCESKYSSTSHNEHVVEDLCVEKLTYQIVMPAILSR